MVCIQLNGDNLSSDDTDFRFLTGGEGGYQSGKQTARPHLAPTEQYRRRVLYVTSQRNVQHHILSVGINQ
jgi:hypothetical protein